MDDSDGPGASDPDRVAETAPKTATIRRAAWVALAVGAVVLVASLLASRRSDPDGKLRKQLQDAFAGRRSPTMEVRRSSGHGIESLLPADRLATWSSTERRLLALAPDPADLPGSYRLADVAVDDPTDALLLGDRWYAPRVRTGDCTRAVDMASVPSLSVTYVPGESALMAPTTPYTLVISAPHAVGFRLYLVDTSSQRDALAATFVDFVGGTLPATCPGAPLNGTPAPVVAPSLGSSRTAFTTTGPLSGNTTSVVSVGDRMLAVVSIGTFGPSSSSRRLPSPEQQEPLVATIVHALEASSLARS